MARAIVGHCLRHLCALGVLAGYASPAWSQTPDGARVFQASCATRHTGAPDSRAPGIDSLRVRTPQAILDSLVTGAMRPQGSRLSGPERRAVAEFILWQYRAGQGGVLGGMEWGAAADAERAYFAVSDVTTSQAGGLHAVNLATGKQAWFMPPQPPTCTGSGRGCNAAQSAAVTAIAGAVFSASNDGSLRAFSTSTGELLWQFDTNRDFSTVNGVPARGASINGPGAVVAGGMVYVSSGFGAFGGRPGNVLLAFGPE
jgi:PQQ-like domain